MNSSESPANCQVCKISKPDRTLSGTVTLNSSKSESNRALLIQALCKFPLKLNNLSQANDTKILVRLLRQCAESSSENSTYDAGNAGTVLRFLTAYFSVLPGMRILTGDQRMKQRPVKPLVEALRKLGAEITYLGNEGYPPLKISGSRLAGGEVEIDASMSSQYASALLLISPSLSRGLCLHFKGETTSVPYIHMTLKMMEQFNVRGIWKGRTLSIEPQHYSCTDEVNQYSIEADWSAASYWYSMVALSGRADLRLMGLKAESLQGDSILKDLYVLLGVKTEFIEGGIRLSKEGPVSGFIACDFSDCPDIAQTFIVTAAGLRIPVLLNGLHTLKIKETDRLFALREELKRVGITAEENYPDSLEINSYPDRLNSGIPTEAHSYFCFETYGDHRMAMSFAPLAMIFDSVGIMDPDVVEKSYPAFWEDFKSVGFKLEFV